MSRHYFRDGAYIVLNSDECMHLADDYICTCAGCNWYMDTPSDGFCKKYGGCIHFKKEKRLEGGTMENGRTWIKAAGIRAGKTMAQSALALLPAAATIAQVDWKTVVGTALLAGVASLLTSCAGLPEVKQ